MEINNLSHNVKDHLKSDDTRAFKINKKNKKTGKIWFIFGSIFGIIVLLTGIIYLAIVLPVQKIYNKVQLIQKETTALKQSVSDKDINQVKIGISRIQSQIKIIESDYKKIGYFKIIPFINGYYQDGNQVLSIAKDGLDTGNILITAIEPYKDFLGLKGASIDSNKTTQDRIAFLTQSIEGLIPYLDTIDVKVSNIENSLSQININRYPEKYKNIEIRSTFNNLVDTVSQIHTFIKNGKPILGKTSWLLGKDSPRKYLIIFQNDGELRPSGGFWTAYSTVSVSNGKVTPGQASNIYDLDDKLASTTPSPRIIKAYHINVPILNLRDNNLSPDFPTDAQIFLDQYTKAMGNKDKFDAVIAIDTQILVDMVKILGKLDTRVGTFTANPDKRCDGCPSIIYDLEWISGRPRNYIEKNRKDFMNPLMSALLANVMGSEKTKMPLIMEAFFKDLNEKHIMAYFPDLEMEKIGDLANVTGKIVDTSKNVDYFHLNDANFASAKSNIFITQKIKDDVIIKNGVAEHKVSVTYTNPAPPSNCNLEKGDLCLNAPTYRDMFRFYVPTGSKLIKMTGSEVQPVLYEELNKQVFEGFYGNKSPLYARSSSKTSINYTSGATIGSTYTLLLQKQPGTKPVPFELTVNGQKQPAFDWVADKTIKIKL
jgi:hypothetical protein